MSLARTDSFKSAHDLPEPVREALAIGGVDVTATVGSADRVIDFGLARSQVTDASIQETLLGEKTAAEALADAEERTLTIAREKGYIE